MDDVKQLDKSWYFFIFVISAGVCGFLILITTGFAMGATGRQLLNSVDAPTLLLGSLIIGAFPAAVTALYSISQKSKNPYQPYMWIIKSTIFGALLVAIPTACILLATMPFHLKALIFTTLVFSIFNTVATFVSTIMINMIEWGMN